jgi:hypothetical protein
MPRTRKKRIVHFPHVGDGSVFRPWRKFRFRIWGKDRWLYLYEEKNAAQRGFDDRFFLFWGDSKNPIEKDRVRIGSILEILEEISEKPGFWYKRRE